MNHEKAKQKNYAWRNARLPPRLPPAEAESSALDLGFRLSRFGGFRSYMYGLRRSET